MKKRKAQSLPEMVVLVKKNLPAPTRQRGFKGTYVRILGVLVA